jgi:hypothetical protein
MERTGHMGDARIYEASPASGRTECFYDMQKRGNRTAFLLIF